MSSIDPDRSLGASNGDASDPDEATDTPNARAFEEWGMNAGFVEEIRGHYAVDPSSVDESWAPQFNGGLAAPGAERPASPPRAAAAPLPRQPAARQAQAAPPPPVAPSRAASSPQAASAPSPAASAQQRELASFGGVTPTSAAASLHVSDKHARVLRLIHSYRARGHRIAQSDPLGGQANYFPELDPAHYGFGHEDLDQAFTAGDLPGGSVQTLREILDRLKRTYCGAIGAEFTHVQDPGRKAWLMQRMEQSENQPQLDDAEQRHILEKLSAAEFFERFLHTKFLGQKRFSLEGAESLIPLLDAIVEDSPKYGIREIVFGMAHRGRLNVLSNILGKSHESIFSEFEDSPMIDVPFGSGDVKYHKGFSHDRRVRSGERVHLTLTSNPSHLEVVDPVVEGRTKAKQVRAGDADGETIVPVLIHGDAAFAGQGIVAETLNLSQLRGYCTGGTLHVVVNNQIGFTTTPAEARSTLYCTDVAKMIQVPIFHVNGDEPEAVVHCVQLAMEYRQRFGDDVVIDLICYRRHGHNEGDEPAFTQPRLYAKIRKRETVRALYAKHLVERGMLTPEMSARIEEDLQEQLHQALRIIKTKPQKPDEGYEPNGRWEGYSRTRPVEVPETGVPMDRLAMVAEALGRVPSYFHVHPKLRSLLDKRGKAITQGARLDWAMGELLAYGTLLLEGTPVRLSGQDSSRATFSHRHAVFVDQDSGEEYVPLNAIHENQAHYDVYDSLLSEAAVLGFEYGYSLADPGSLVLWEAQFGDFVNGAQVIIDQFITSAHVKWGRMSGLVMLLPHGFEGQGPEHSSARVERFLQVCAEDCLQVVNCTTPAQFFHVLRRQMRRKYRAPMVVLTPKSLLRNPACTSAPEDLASGHFQPVLDDELAREQPEAVRRVLMCSGKVYYDLLVEREQRFGDDQNQVALVRIEELYPWPAEMLKEILGRYPLSEAGGAQLFWVQEEPANMGGWTFVRDRMWEGMPSERLHYAGRQPSASPAVGSPRIHRKQLAEFLEAAFSGLD